MSLSFDDAFRRALREQAEGRVQAAAHWFNAALAIEPAHPGALSHYTLLALTAGQTAAALALSERAVRAAPGDAVVHHFRGLALRRGGHLAEALEAVRRAVGIDPGYVDAHVNLGNLLLESGDAANARASYESALALDPGSAPACNNVGNAWRELGQPDAALDWYRRALALDPRHVEAMNNVGNMLKDLGDADGAVAAFRGAIALAPNRADIWSNLLLSMNASDTLDAEAIAHEHRAFGTHFARLIQHLPAIEPGADAPDGRIRVGYVSSDFRRHAVATFFLPLLEAHDRSRFAIHCYYNGLRADEVTTRVQSLADRFVPVAGLRDGELAARIRADRIDVLVDLNGHTAGNRLTAFIQRPARVQVTWLGYLCTTGLPEIDFRLTDPLLDPPGVTDGLHAEVLWRLPATSWCYAPYAESPAVGPLPALGNGVVTFACLNNPGKSSASALALWAAILAAVPASRLIVQTSPHRSRIDAVARFFGERGIAADRIEQVARRPLAEYLALYARADIALDTWPYTGATTTCDALWMGVPVLTLATDRPFARSGASLLPQVDLGDWVASTPEAYVAKAVRAAADLESLAQLRAALRARVAGSRLVDRDAFARDVEAAFVSMLHRG